MHKLVISDDEGKTTVVPLVRDEITIGRREGNTIRLTERNVSRRHARLRRTEDGFVVEDLGSYNGVRINGGMVEGARLLAHGDRVSIGDYELALDEEGGKVEDAPPSESIQLPAFEISERTSPARLVMLTAPAPGAEYALSAGALKIGRAEELDVWVNHRSISREHAIFESSEDGITVRDLESANGVRLNGEDIVEAELRSGDILELGQVRFRFVDEGEAYVYDAEDAHIAPPAPAPRGLTPPIVAAIMIIVVATAIGAAIATSSGQGGAEGAVTSSSAEPSLAAVSGPSEQARALALEAIRSCRAAVTARRFDDAVRFAAEATDRVPNLSSADECRKDALAGRAEDETLARGEAALGIGEVDSAYFIFAELPAHSLYAEHESVVGARAMFVERHLDLARRSLRASPEEAARQAKIVLGVQQPGEEERTEAESIVARAERALRAASRAPRTRPAPGATSPAPATSPASAPAPAAPRPTAAPAPAAAPRPTAAPAAPAP